MSNAIISYPDKTLAATLSGGSWNGSFPLDNLKDRLLSKKARTTNALAASSIILIDAGAAITVRCLALIAHNFSYAATVRVRGFTDSGYTLLVSGSDTGTVSAVPQTITSTEAIDCPKNWISCYATDKSARYWKVEITDTANAAGYIEVGRCWLGSATIHPNIGMEYGASVGYNPRDETMESLGGVVWGNAKAAQRTSSASFPVLDKSDKFGMLLMQNILGRMGECLWIMDATAEPREMMMESYLATIEQASPIAYPYFDNYEMNLTVKEIL